MFRCRLRPAGDSPSGAALRPATARFRPDRSSKPVSARKAGGAPSAPSGSGPTPRPAGIDTPAQGVYNARPFALPGLMFAFANTRPNLFSWAFASGARRVHAPDAPTRLAKTPARPMTLASPRTPHHEPPRYLRIDSVGGLGPGFRSAARETFREGSRRRTVSCNAPSSLMPLSGPAFSSSLLGNGVKSAQNACAFSEG